MTFSTEPFCHEEYGSQKKTGRPKVFHSAFSVPRSSVSVRLSAFWRALRRRVTARCVADADLSLHFVRTMYRDFRSCWTETMTPLLRLPSMESPSQSPNLLRDDTTDGRSVMPGTGPNPCVPSEA